MIKRVSSDVASEDDVTTVHHVGNHVAHIYVVCLRLQVAMGYSHSLVIARQEGEEDVDRLKKLPEYVPRTL